MTETHNKENANTTLQEWEATFDAIPDMISIHDREFNIIRANKAFKKVFGKTDEDLKTLKCYELVHDSNKCLNNCPHVRTLLSGDSNQIEYYDSTRGSFFEVSTSPIRTEDGEITATVHIMRDISARKSMEEKLIVTDRLASIGELVSGIAHELNNPLTSVIGFSEMLLNNNQNKDIAEELEIIYKEAVRSSVIVKNLLIFARKHSKHRQLVAVNNLIDDVLKLRSYEEGVHSIAIEKSLDMNIPEISADPFQIQQVILNILINAEYFLTNYNHGGTIHISTAASQDWLTIQISDDGPGISSENIGHIFDPFFTTKEVGKGTGLGLSICHGLINEHGGDISVQSVEGQGATFTIRLPLEIKGITVDE